jgi:hypothetical protein
VQNRSHFWVDVWAMFGIYDDFSIDLVAILNQDLMQNFRGK